MDNFENQIIDAIKKIRNLRQRPDAVEFLELSQRMLQQIYL